jgi:hypothetical protein
MFPNDKGEMCANISFTKKDVDGNVVEVITTCVNPDDFNDFWEDHFNSIEEVIEYVNQKNSCEIPVPEDVEELLLN